MEICDILIEGFHSKSETEHFSGNMNANTLHR